MHGAAPPSIACAALLLAACAPSPERGGFASADPAAQIPAILNSVRNDDPSAIPHLVDALCSDDPAVRLMAQDALKQLTGTDRGYRFSDPPLDRDEAVQRWVEFVRSDPAFGPSHHPAAPANTPAAPTTKQ